MVHPAEVYTRHLEVARVIGAELDGLVKRKYHTYRAAGEAFATVTELTPLTATQRVREFCGTAAAYLSPHLPARSRLQETNDTNLERLSVLYELLEINARDNIVQLAREINPRFSYPPQRPRLEELALQYANKM